MKKLQVFNLNHTCGSSKISHGIEHRYIIGLGLNFSSFTGKNQCWVEVKKNSNYAIIEECTFGSSR